MHSTRGHRDSPREGLIDRGEYSRQSGGCLEGEEKGRNTESDYRQSEDWGNTWAI
jgi:hypothetical protein